MMKEIIKQLVQDKKLHQKVADQIMALDEHSQGQALNFIHKFNLGINFSQEFFGYLFDIAKRDDKKIAEIVNESDVTALANQPKLPHARRMDLLRELLRQKRFKKNIRKDSFVPPERALPAKKIVFARQKGSWLKRCPGTSGHICCNYLVVNSIAGCPFDCTYCYLQAYLNKPAIEVFTNIDDLVKQLKLFFAEKSGAHFRIGTGEFSDSLALDKEQGLAKKLIELFARQEDHLLELKTKSNKVGHLLDLQHKGKTIFAWSVNPQKIIDSEELGAVSLEERLNAAEKCVKAGYPVGFHFDPIIYYDGWENDYEEVVDAIFDAVDPKKIAWISLGALRYVPELKNIIEKRFPHSRITLGNLDISADHKLRYFDWIRLEIFKNMNNFIRSRSKEVYLYLCMESQEMWDQVGIVNSKSNPYAGYFKFFRK